MSLSLHDLPLASRLLDDALELTQPQLEPWLAALPRVHQHVVPMLRLMLAEHRAPRHSGFMASGPRWLDAADDPAAARAGDLVGPYRLIREIGRGGMSTVWLAERPDGVVKREVALKMPPMSLKCSPQIERFERERDVLALLNHPQIARLYDAGVAPSGQPYIVLEHVDGQPITAACDALALDVPARLRIFLQVLAAVGHAHKHLVVHRDIKPSNVFVGRDGQVKLLDFGIAKLLTASTDAMQASPLTRDGGSALTPRYAAPEQVSGQPISTASDIYSLGVLLYELLAGCVPHADAQRSVADAVNAAMHLDPVRPSLAQTLGDAAATRGIASAERLRSLLAGDLDTIVLKALRKAPGDRYSSIERFTDDIQHYLASQPIAAQPPSLVHRARLFARRHRGATAAGAIGCAVAVMFAALLWRQHALTTAQEARSSAVREFMLDMVEDAEPDDGHADAEVTGRQMVQGALNRAHDRFAAQPQLLGDVLGELGRMFLRFGDEQKAAGALAEAMALLEVHAPRDDPALNKVRAWTAEIALAANDLTRARSLATLARNACTRQDEECAKARAYASFQLAEADTRSGRPQAALQNLHDSVADTARGFGPAHGETAMAWEGLAIVAREAGEMQAADRAIRHALAIAEHAVLRARDRIALVRTQAVIELDLGRSASAQGLLQDLLARTTERGERALQLRLLATAQLALGQPDTARAAADQALALAEAAGTDPEVWFAHQAHARALSQLGQGAAAVAEMRTVIEGLAAAQYAPDSAPMLRAHRFVADMLARQGDLDAAWQEAVPTVAVLARRADLPIELGQLLDLQGGIQRDRGHLAEAARLHQQAHELLSRQLPADHPFLARNALYQERAKGLPTQAPMLSYLTEPNRRTR